MKKILITGATGFIGNNVAHWQDPNTELYYTGRTEENDLDGTYLGYDFTAIDKSFLDVDVLYHQAAITDTLIHDRVQMFEVNYHKPLNLFKKAIDAGCKQIVYASSCAVYGDVPAPFKVEGPFNPLNVYGESKLAFDEAILQLQSPIPIVGLRYSNVYGPGECHKKHMSSMIYQIIYKMKNNKSPRLFEFGEQKRDFVYIHDIVSMNLRASQHPVSGIYNAGFGESRSFNDIVRIINEVRGTDIQPEYFPNPIKEHYQELTECDMSLTNLWYKPTFTLERGIKDYLAFLE